MKKFLLLVCAAVISMSASAQEGQKAVGFSLLYGSEIDNVGLGVKGQYNLTDNLRGEAAFDYYLKKDGWSMWDINANMHYLFNVGRKITVYPLAGLGFVNVSFEAGDKDYVAVKSSKGRLGVNLGGGVDFALTKNISLNGELKYQFIDNFNQVVLGTGLNFKF